ncbi:hypothetical protein Z946_669 [Sulfitobacter noctilucicola]|nr:hypothetical protein Z946_669 [Sulfitobacter noctilucicola]
MGASRLGQGADTIAGTYGPRKQEGTVDSSRTIAYTPAISVAGTSLPAEIIT